MAAPTGDAWGWTFRAAAGDPPAQASTIAAVGGAGPLIVGALRNWTGNAYRSSAPKGIDEPLTASRQPGELDVESSTGEIVRIDGKDALCSSRNILGSAAKNSSALASDDHLIEKPKPGSCSVHAL